MLKIGEPNLFINVYNKVNVEFIYPDWLCLFQIVHKAFSHLLVWDQSFSNYFTYLKTELLCLCWTDCRERNTSFVCVESRLIFEDIVFVLVSVGKVALQITTIRSVIAQSNDHRFQISAENVPLVYAFVYGCKFHLIEVFEVHYFFLKYLCLVSSVLPEDDIRNVWISPKVN